MTFWQWFKAHGDDLLSFLTMVGVVAQNQPGLVDPSVDKWMTFGLAVLTIAHKVFFQPPTNPQQPVAPAKVN